jgi:hypothetical protein
MEITAKDRRRLLKAYWVDYARVTELRRRLIAAEAAEIIEDENSECEADWKALFFLDHRFRPPLILPLYPDFPPECSNMICGGKGRRSGRPCQCKEIYPNGRCKWHGGASTGPKTAEGKKRSLANLLRGPRSYRTLIKVKV